MPRASFIQPMLLLQTDKLPDDSGRWEYGLKFDGYRAIAFKTGRKLHLRSRNDNDFKSRYPSIILGLVGMPDETLIDGRSLPSINGENKGRNVQTAGEVIRGDWSSRIQMIGGAGWISNVLR